jgi:GT2 family glycosyltransferase
MRSDANDFRVIVCDNRSTDGSLEKIKAWANGNLPITFNLDERLKPLVSPAIEKPVPYIEYRQNEAESGNMQNDRDVPLILIQNDANNGFSAGNNTGIRLALKKDADYIWLLNNDTLIKQNTLKELLQHMQSREDTGIVGSVIYHAAEPTKIQTYGGGTISHCLGVDRFLYSADPVDYVAGTSLFTKREVFETIGLLDEKFFFYWEDVDFSRRALIAGWKLTTADKAVVFHKFSASVGKQSLKSDLFKVASLTYYFKKHQKKGRWIFPVLFNISGMIAKRIFRWQFNRVKPIVKEAFRVLKIF